MSNVIGLDMGSVFIKGVLLREYGAPLYRMEKSGRNYGRTAQAVIDGLLSDARAAEAKIFATGCGERCLSLPSKHVGEMNCLMKFVHTTVKEPCIILDMGGQAGRLCIMNEEGRLEAFDYSAKCASGSGMVLESVSRILRLSFDELSEAARRATKVVSFTTSCAVFAESEAITAVAKGEHKEDIVAGFHDSICQKFKAMLEKHPQGLPVVATGGMARDCTLLELLAEKSQRRVTAAPEPQYCIAHGAALLGCGPMAE